MFCSNIRLLATWLAFAGVLLGGPATACAGDLVSAYHAALQADPRLRSVELEEKVAGEIHRQSLAGFLPVVTAQYQTQRTDQKVLRADNAVYAKGSANYPTTNTTVSLTQPLFNMKDYYTYTKSQAGEAKADADLNAAREDMIVRVVASYLGELKAEADLTLARRERDTLQSEDNVAEVKYKSGLISVSDLRDVQARFAEVDAQVYSSEVKLEKAQERLRDITGVIDKSPEGLRDDAKLPELVSASVSADKLVDQALTDNFEIKSGELAVTMADKESDRVFAGHYPTVDLIARYNQNDTKGSLFGGGSNVRTTDVLLQVDLPVYSGGRTQSQAREATYKKEQAQQDLEAKKRKIEGEVRAGFINLFSSTQKIASLKRSLEAKRSLNELRTAGYRAGVNSLLDHLEAQRDFYIAQRDLVAARFNHLLDYVRMKQALGSLTEADLDTINGLLQHS